MTGITTTEPLRCCCVVDAGVAVKWYLDEEGGAPAVALLDAAEQPLVPDHFFAEFGNVLWKHWRRQLLSRGRVDSILDAVRDLPFRVRSSWDLLPMATGIAVDCGITVYDALYVALGVESGALVVTADRRLRNAMAPTPIGPMVLHLDDLEGSYLAT